MMASRADPRRWPGEADARDTPKRREEAHPSLLLPPFELSDGDTQLDTMRASGVWLGPSETALETGSPIQNEMPPSLRREASVLAEAAAERRRSGHVLRSVLKKGFMAFPTAADSMLPVVRRFEALPRRRQILLVLSPYLGALTLLLFWFGRSSAVELESANPMSGIEATPLSGIVEVTSYRPPAHVHQGEDNHAAFLDTASPGSGDATDYVALPLGTEGLARSADPDEIQEPRSGPPTRASDLDPAKSHSGATGDPSAPQIQGVVRVLPRASAIFSRPSGGSNRAALLRKGHVLTVFERFPAPDGWILARSEKGTVGFVSTFHLQGESDPRVEGRKRKRRRRR